MRSMTYHRINTRHDVFPPPSRLVGATMVQPALLEYKLRCNVVRSTTSFKRLRLFYNQLKELLPVRFGVHIQTHLIKKTFS